MLAAQAGAGWSKWTRVVQEQKQRESLTELQRALDDKRAAENHAGHREAEFLLERTDLERKNEVLTQEVERLANEVAALEKDIVSIKLSAIDVSEAAEARDEEVYGELEIMRAERQDLLGEVDQLRAAASESSLLHARENADLSARLVRPEGETAGWRTCTE